MTEETFDIDIAFKALDLHVPHPGDYPEDEDPLSELSELSELEDEDNNDSLSTLPDREEGEIPDDKKISANRKRRMRRTQARAARAKEAALQLEKAQEELKPVLAALYGVNVNEIHIHNVKRNRHVLRKLQDREESKGAPLDRADIDSLIPDFVWMHEPGIHIGFLSTTGQEHLTIVFAVKIRAWDTMEPATQAEIQETLQVVMDFGDISYAIKNNAATKGPHGVRGDRGTTSTKEKRGTMYGVGWHNAQEEGKTLASYAPNKKDEKSIQEYNDLHSKLPKVAALYRDGLSCLFPGGADEIQENADREGVLSFGDPLDGVSPQRPFANSLTTTREGFCNFQHQDYDFCFVAFGLWWGAKRVHGHKWSFDKEADHDKISGGGFIWGEFSIGVDFERAHGLVEIFWRGKVDFHGTLQSQDQVGYTRFGTSIQITTKGVNAMRNVWKPQELVVSGHDVHRLAPKSAARITTPQMRAQKAMESKTNKRKTRS